MAPIATAEEAVDLADRFLKKYYFFIRLDKVVKENGSWSIDFDTAVLGPKKIIHVKIDGESGGVTEFTSD